MMKLRHISAIAVLLFVAAPLTSIAAPAHTGIRGRTLIFTGPIFPGPAVPAVVTTFPVSTTFTVLSSQTGRMVAQVTSDANGDFSLALHPGRYIVVAAGLADTLFCSYETPDPFEVTVRARQFSGAGFVYIADCHGIEATSVP